MYNNDEYINATFTIKDASSLIGLSSSALRNIESYFGIPIERNPSGQRIYNDSVLKLFKQIKSQTDKGLQYAEIKKHINIDVGAYSNPTISRVEVMSDDRSAESKNFDLIVKPYSDRINALESRATSLTERIIVLERDNASLSERDKLHEEIISSKEELIESLRNQLAEDAKKKRWWKIWS